MRSVIAAFGIQTNATRARACMLSMLNPTVTTQAASNTHVRFGMPELIHATLLPSLSRVTQTFSPAGIERHRVALSSGLSVGGWIVPCMIAAFRAVIGNAVTGIHRIRLDQPERWPTS